MRVVGVIQYKGDVNGAEEYYHKCTVVEPSDGVALANYGRLVMKLHGDEAKALSYFERAVQASPEDRFLLDTFFIFGKTIGYLLNLSVCVRVYFFLLLFSNVLGAYASFLWEINDEDDDEVDDSFGNRSQQGREDSEV